MQRCSDIQFQLTKVIVMKSQLKAPAGIRSQLLVRYHVGKSHDFRGSVFCQMEMTQCIAEMDTLRELLWEPDLHQDPYT